MELTYYYYCTCLTLTAHLISTMVWQYFAAWSITLFGC